MSDARFPTHWLTDRRIRRLSDRGFRVFVEALAYSVNNRTNGLLSLEDFEDLGCRGTASEVSELVDRDLVTPEGDGNTFLLVDYRTTQTSANEFVSGEAQKAYSREYKAVERATDDKAAAREAGQKAAEEVRRKLSGKKDGKTDGNLPFDKHPKARPGKARPGQERQGAATEEAAEWPKPSLCKVCDGPMNVQLAAAGETTHPTCEVA